jgi:2'-5' RNA ligase
MSAEIKTLRLFFALWPDGAVRASLAQLVDTLKQTATAKWVKGENLHITLAFLGEVNEDRLPVVSQVGDSIVGQSFELSLDRIEFWPKKGIICLSPLSAPEALNLLANSLTAGLGRIGFVMENRPFRAHLTLARKACRDSVSSQTIDDPIRWRVSSFSLIESQISRAGSLYLVRKSWNLPSFQAIPDDSSVR